MNCKPGDLAVIIRSDSIRESCDLGKIVEVLEAGDDWSDMGDSRTFWRCESKCGPILCQSETWDWSLETHCDIPDSHLRPLPPPESIDSTEDERELVMQ